MRRLPLAVLILTCAITGCTDPDAPDTASLSPTAPMADINHHSASGDVKAFIGGWLEGEADAVSLRYTRSYFCEEPPVSAASDTNCEIGAPAEVFPRPGQLPLIYALAPAFQPAPDPSTIHCVAGTVCPNHPPHLDASRTGGGTNTFAPAHSHIITEQRGGWHQTVNIRVASLAAWNQIAYEPSGMRLAKVRALQADPLVGGAGLISGDRPTNIFFFFEVHRR